MITLLSPDVAAALVKLIDERIAAQLEASDRQQGPASPVLTVAEAADYLRTSAGAVYKRIKRGQLDAVRSAGSPILLRRADLEALCTSTKAVLG
jgi:excisionase family DNA binding protein